MMAADRNPSKKICTEEENSNKINVKSFTPRDYQIEILEIAKKKNTIACLGTGTGKTFIAVMLIREFANAVRIPYDNGGKRIFFLVPTVPLVHQQQKIIENYTDLKSRGYSGDMNVDSWNNNKWTAEFTKHEALVMTAEIFRIIVDHAFIPLSRIQLLIIDECHRAQGDHPYRQALKCFTDQSSEMPRIFGLSASLINGKCKPTQLEKQLHDLEITLQSSITTASDIVDLQKYGADPDEFLVYYKPYSFESNLFSKINDLRNIIKMEHSNFVGRGIEDILDVELTFFDKPLRCLNSLEITLKTLGPWCALKAAEIYNEELCTVLTKCHHGIYMKEFEIILQKFKHFLTNFINECKAIKFYFGKNNISSWPHKLQRLLEIFLAIKNSKKLLTEFKAVDVFQPLNFQDDPEKYYKMLKAGEFINKCNTQICCIVFVEQRITAYILCEWLREISTMFNELNFLKSEFIVGHGTTGMKKTSMSEKSQKKVLADFRKRKCNVLISTCVLEEGMDVQQCNVVIRFDLPFEFRAYVQSKGRARAKNSIYVLMSEVGENANRFWADMCNFKTIEKMLLSKCHNRPVPEGEEINENMADYLIAPYMPYGLKGPRITLISAISLINRYCASLPTDMATKLVPKWFVRIIDADAPAKEYECTLKMPINSPLRIPVVGEIMSQKKLSKMAAALKACELLDKIGELNEHLVPISCLVDKAVNEELGPLEEEDGNGAQPGTNRRRQVYKKHVPIFFKNCRPQPLFPSYLHILKMELIEPLPPELNPRNRPIIDPGACSKSIALLLAKKLPVVNSFPIFTKCGKLKVSISLCQNMCILSMSEIQTIEKFHQFIFTDSLQLANNMHFSPDSAEASFYVVPIIKDEKFKWIIDWQFMHAIENHSYHIMKGKTAKTVDRLSFEEALFKDAVLLKSYKIDCWKTEKKTFHHTHKLCYDISPCSMLNKFEKISFKEYYKSKYNVDILDGQQPLISTYQNQSLHQWKPLYLSVNETFETYQPLSKSKQKRKNYQEYLVPELCIIYPLPSSFFHLIQSLPTILFRLASLLFAEELRQNVATSGLVGNLELGKSFQWPYFDLETSDRVLKKHLAEHGYITFPTNNIFIPQDIVKQGNKIINFENNIDLLSHPGPSPSLLLQALTSKSVGDEFDLERLEMIGDSFLKYVMSIKIYMKYPTFDEGKLTKLRSKLIQNLHLYQRAKKEKLPEFLIHTPFSCNTTWLPPCFVVDEPHEIKISNKKSKTDIINEEKSSKYLYFMKQIISDKSIADSVEALIGAYLLSCGQKGAIMFMSWLGLNPLPNKKDSEVNKTDFDNWPPEPPSPIIGEVVDTQKCLYNLTSGFETFEAQINYKFRDKALLLQAFTHPSYYYNEITDCYQRLEFLGDAVLDYLITRQLYEDPNNLSPGKLTDLRSALVNNIYFASLAVKFKYHKYLKILSPHLFGLLKQYIKIYEESESFKFFEEYGYNLEEIECFELDEVEVPKALGDIFESVAGAIYLDSGMSLNTVWEICYPMMEPALRHLALHVPVSPVRELYEIMKSKDVFIEISQTGDKTYIKVILPNGEEVVGVGTNKKVAKRSAAKRALAKWKSSMLEPIRKLQSEL